jgi:alpha-amylase
MRHSCSHIKTRWIIGFPILLIFMLIGFESCSKDNGGPNDNSPDDTTQPPELPVPFDKVPALKDMVLYEVNFMAFGPSCTINNVLSRIDSIKNLGVNVIWLMPVFPEGQLNGVGSPYCVQNYLEVNPDLGTLSDLKDFVGASHKREMAVILDWVANHTAWDNPWIENTDWYTHDSQNNIISPPGTGWNDVADLNYSSASMRLEMIRSMKYWITTCNVDGFRCDAADMVPFDFWKQAIDSLKNLPGRDLILLAEGSRTDHFTAGFQMTYSWDFQTALKNIYHDGMAASTLYQTNTNEYSALPSGAEKLRYITNHDIYAWDSSPVVQFVNEQGSLSAFVVTAFMRGVPLICSGQEVANAGNISFFEPNPVNWSQNNEIFTQYKKVMQIRDSLPEVRSGNLVTYNNDDVLLFKRTDVGSEVLIIVNVRNSSVNISLPEDLANTNWLNQWDQSELNLGSEIELPPFEFILAKRAI